VAEYLADRHGEAVGLIRCGLPDAFLSQGTRDFMLNQAGLSTEAIVAAVKSARAGRENGKSGRIRNLFRFNRHAKTI